MWRQRWSCDPSSNKPSACLSLPLKMDEAGPRNKKNAFRFHSVWCLAWNQTGLSKCYTVSTFIFRISQPTEWADSNVWTQAIRDLPLYWHLPHVSLACLVSTLQTEVMHNFSLSLLFIIFLSVMLTFDHLLHVFFRSILQSTMNVRWFKSNFTFTSLYLIY